MTREELVLNVIWGYLGTPYLWGGDDPRGFDCSGLMIEGLKSVGVFPRYDDTTADGLRKRFEEINREDIEPGDLVFWMNSGKTKAVHVGMVTENIDCYIGAEGGGSSTLSTREAFRRNAYVMVRPIDSRGQESSRRYGRWTTWSI